MSEEERKQLANRLGVSVEEIGGGKEYGQFWHGPDEYPIYDKDSVQKEERGDTE